VVPQAAKPVLVRMRVRVDHPRHDREPRAVHDLTGWRLDTRTDRDDPPLVHDDVGAGEMPRADVDEPVAKDDQLPVGSIAVAGAMPPPSPPPATSITLLDSSGRWSSECGKPSSSRTSAVRATATRPT